tara:strand:- start:210 stop:452 length:243 start_codon:yes stop_codon:yes gene_type:complete
MVNFCKYSELFGKVGEGLHSYRIFNIAVIDVIATILFAFLLQRFFLKKYKFYQVLIGLFISGIISHRLFCVRTTMDKIIF